MNKNEKLTHNAVRARKAQKKRANKQDTPKKNKGWFSRLFAFIGCLLLVSALAVPCFADGTDYPVISVDPDVMVDGVRVNLDGYYQVAIDSEEINIIDMPDNSTIDLFSAYVDTGYYRIVDIDGQIVSSGIFSLEDVHIIKSNDYAELYIGYNGRMVYGERDIMDADIMIYFYFSVDPMEQIIDSQNAPWDYTPYQIAVLEYESGFSKVTGVWSDIMNWIITAIASVQSIFYAEGSLTFLGTLCAIGVCLALSFLLISVISRFLHLRG